MTCGSKTKVVADGPRGQDGDPAGRACGGPRIPLLPGTDERSSTHNHTSAGRRARGDDSAEGAHDGELCAVRAQGVVLARHDDVAQLGELHPQRAQVRDGQAWNDYSIECEASIVQLKGDLKGRIELALEPACIDRRRGTKRLSKTPYS